MSDPHRPSGPQLPYDELSAAIGSDPAARAELEGLRARLAERRPDATQVRRHVDALRAIRDVEARIANWWDDPETQRWIMTIDNAGL